MTIIFPSSSIALPDNPKQFISLYFSKCTRGNLYPVIFYTLRGQMNHFLSLSLVIWEKSGRIGQLWRQYWHSAFYHAEKDWFRKARYAYSRVDLNFRKRMNLERNLLKICATQGKCVFKLTNKTIIICFSVRFSDNSLLVLKMHFQVFSFESKKVQGFSSDTKILMWLSMLFHLKNCLSFLKF